MANQKVPQLPVLTAVTGEDLFYVVDVSDTTDDPTGSSKQITRDNILTNVNAIDFDVTATTASQVGSIKWDSGTGTLNVGVGDEGGTLIDLQVGQEELVRVYNAEATTLLRGEIVYVFGSQGNRPSVKRAIATGDGYSVTTLGMVTSNITSGSEGYVTTFGIISNLDTSSLTGGTAIWLSPTVAGGYTETKPQAPYHTVLIGYVVRVDATVGSVFINISNGWEIDELHDVRISGVTDGDLLVRSTYSGSPVWVNTKILDGSYRITGTLTATTVSATTISATTYYNLPPDLWTQNGSSIYYNGGNVGVGITDPTRKFEVVDGNYSVYFNLTGTSGPLAAVITSDFTKLARFNVSDGSSSISVGLRTSGETANPGFGAQNDTYIYANTTANGLNIINAPSTGNGDYIRLYAGLTVNQGQSHLHVQGSGSTKGYVGINTENPTERLHVSGNTLINGSLTATTISATTVSATTFYGSGTNLTGVVKGSGTTNYLPKWTGTTGLGNSIIQDDGTSVGIGGSPTAAYKLRILGSNVSGVYGETTAGTNKYGVVGFNIGDGPTQTYVGILGYGTYADTPYTDSIYVGGRFIADGSTNNLNYGGWFQDGTEGLNKVLISATADGKTNWSSDLTGLTSVRSTTISATTISATTFYGSGTNLTGVVKGSGTTNYLPKWTGTTEQGNSLIYDDGTNIGIGTTTPGVKLDVQITGGTGNQLSGRFLAGTNANGNAGGITVGTTQTQCGYVYGEQTASSTGDLVFGVQNLGSYAERARILGNGNFGIGTTLPSEKLHVSGNTIVSGTISGGTMVITSTPTNNNSNTEILSRNSTTGNVEYIDSSTIGGGSFNYGLANAIMTGTFLT